MPIPAFWSTDREAVERWRTAQLKELARLNGTLIEELWTPCQLHPIQPCERSWWRNTWPVTPLDEDADQTLSEFERDPSRPVQDGWALALWMEV